MTLLLVGVAIYQHMHSATLSLPVSPSLTIPTILLPVLAAANTLFHLVRLPTTPPPPRQNTLLAQTLQAVQALATAVLATLLLSHVVPSAARTCVLSTTWQRLFREHDADAIRRIQDAFHCCGFNTVRDRAWPFPDHTSARRCAETYGREVACGVPWGAGLQRNAGVEFGIVVAVGLFQIAMWLLRDAVTIHIRDKTGVRPRGMIRYGTLHEPEGGRLLPGVVGEEDEAAAEEGGARRGVGRDGERELNPRRDANDATARGAASTQDNNPWA